MSSTSSLRDYQANILSRLEQAKQAGSDASAGYLGVVSGDQQLLINMQEVSETLPVPDVFPVPLVKSWFLGMTNVRGVLYAVNDLGELMTGNKTPITSNARILLVSDSVTPHVAILVEKLVGLRKLETMSMVKADMNDHFCIKAERYQDQDNHVWSVFDANKLIQSQQFMQSF
jgi:twitching motility protein PilI